MNTSTPFARPLYVMLKPAGASCNLACDYCYYTEKRQLYRHINSCMMTEGLLEEFVRQYMEVQTMPQVLFTWHGGEPLLRPLSFYRRALELQRQYARGRQVDNCLQTNGTLLTDEWCEFLRENNFLVGISIDGPEPLHDCYRHDRAGSPSFSDVMRGVRLLQKHGVEWNAMATVNAANAERPQEFYHFFRDIGCQYLQFTPVTPPHGHSVRPDQWGPFLCGVYDEWVSHDVGSVFVQTFEATLANWAGVTPGVCSLSAHCGHVAVMEFNGDVYSCDHFVFPEYRLGNISRQTLTEMLYGEQQIRFAQKKLGGLPRQCRECRWLFACHGECPKNRTERDCYGESGLNYLCEGYRQFFEHFTPFAEKWLTLNIDH